MGFGNDFMEPLFFTPIMIERVWGGNNLARVFGKVSPPEKTIGESWELSDRPEAQSVVACGRFEGRTLRSLLEEFPRPILGRLAPTPRFPMLVKYVDAGDALSVQVHPDDAGAKAFDDLGKCECWVVVHAEPGASIVRGLKEGVTREAYVRAVTDNTLHELLHSFEPKIGDVVALPPGTIHAIGKGLIVAEIQQNSDLTFRIHDYGRVGLDGKPRKLHVSEALAAVRFGALGDEFRGNMTADTVSPRGVRFETGVKIEALLDGKFFDLQRVTIDAGGDWRLLQNGDAPKIVMALDGAGTLNGRALRAGSTGLIPASAGVCSFHADSKLTVLLSEPR